MRTPLPKENPFDRTLLYGLEEIAKFVRMNHQTVRRWIRSHGFPAGKVPGGRWASSTELVDRWIMSRNPDRQPKHGTQG